MELIRNILLEIEAKAPPSGGMQERVAIDGYDRATVNAHLRMLIEEANLVDGRVMRTLGPQGDEVMVLGLTWSGHDFLGAARSDEIWTKARGTILKRGFSITFDMLVEWLKAEARKHLPIP
jgi:Hypothetical protein (DUF2513)